MIKPRFTEENFEILHTKDFKRPENYGKALYIANSFDRLLESKNWQYRLKIILLEKGSLSLSINGDTFLYDTPSVIFINASDKLEKIIQGNSKFKVVFFHPNCISSFITINQLEGNEERDKRGNRDYYFIAPFYYENMRDKSLKMDYIQSRYLHSIVAQMETHLDVQESTKWTCALTALMYQILFKLESQFRMKIQETTAQKMALQYPSQCE